MYASYRCRQNKLPPCGFARCTFRGRCTDFAVYLNSKAQTSNRMHYDSITSQPSGLESQDICIYIYILPPIHYAAIFHKIYGVPGHSLEIQLYFHLPLRFRLLKQQMEKTHTSLSFQLCNVQCQQRFSVCSTCLTQ